MNDDILGRTRGRLDVNGKHSARLLKILYNKFDLNSFFIIFESTKL